MDIETLRDALKIDPDDISAELVEHAVLFEQAGRLAARLGSVADERKEMLARAKASEEAKVGKELADGNEKVTEAIVAGIVVLRSPVLQAHKRLLRAKREAAEAEALKAAWHDRGFALRELAKIHLAMYNAGEVVMAPETRRVRRVETARATKEVAKVYKDAGPKKRKRRSSNG